MIGTSGSDQSRVLYIDKGAKDGLKPDMAVITPDGIVGKLKDVYAHTSQVLVVLPNSNQRCGGAAGVDPAAWGFEGQWPGANRRSLICFRINPVEPGERVITSGGDPI